MKVFISYRRDDLGGHCAALVGRIYDRLSAQYGGESVFMDVDTIPPGADFAAYLGEAVERADVLLAVVGPDWVNLMQQRTQEANDFVRVEVESALQKSIPVVPLLIGGASMPKDADLPESLKSFVMRNAFPVDSGRDFNAHVTRLIADLERHYGPDAAGREEGRGTALEEATAPVISVSEVEAEEEAGEEVFELVSATDIEEGLSSLADEVEASKAEAGLPVSEEVHGMAPIPEGKKRKVAQPWLALVGVISILAILLGAWQPWGSGGDAKDSEALKHGGSAQSKADEGKRKVEQVSMAAKERRPPGEELENFTNSLGMEMVWCPPGGFLMGNPEWERFISSDEGLHEVTLTNGFWIAATEVTQGQWEKLMGNNPSKFTPSGTQAPVENVSWEQAMEFCRKLTETERRAGTLASDEEYTLPTEAQWEYACRAGTAGPYNVEGASLDELGWYGENSDSRTHPVARKKPNAWGLYDMHGNVLEWCLDWYDDYPEGPVSDPTGPAEQAESRVLRGGGWLDFAEGCRSAHRIKLTPDFSYNNLGFRPVRTLIRESEPSSQSRQVKFRTPHYEKETPETTGKEESFTNGLGMQMVWCPPGTFLMGSPESEEERVRYEVQHEVTLTKGFWIASTEVTQEQWENLMGSNPSTFTSSGPQAPVETVGWEQAIEFCQKLTETERKAGNMPSREEYTLPTEAQWEYACRAGTSGPYNVEGASLGDLGWYGENSDNRTHPVSQKKPNAWGIYDMHGNVLEWCLNGSDGFNEYPEESVTDPLTPSEQTSFRVQRGGSVFDYDGMCRSASRSHGSEESVYFVGFRPVRSAVRSASE